MRILHLSDLHLNHFYNKVNISKTRDVLSEALKAGFDHLIITGDITHDADEASFLLFKDILKQFNLWDSKKTTITIGNHDIFGGVYTVKDLINFTDKCKNTDYEKQILNFVNYFQELFVDCYFPSTKSFFPFVKIISDFALIGINTNDVYSSFRNPFASNGKVSTNEFEYLRKLFELEEIQDKRKIVLAHHHYYKNSYDVKSSNNDLWNKIEGYTLKLRGKKKLLKLFRKNNVEILLHGHSHENKQYNRHGIEFYNAGGSIDNDNDTTATINILDLNTDPTSYFINELNLSENLSTNFNGKLVNPIKLF